MQDPWNERNTALTWPHPNLDRNPFETIWDDVFPQIFAHWIGVVGKLFACIQNEPDIYTTTGISSNICSLNWGCRQIIRLYTKLTRHLHNYWYRNSLVAYVFSRNVFGGEDKDTRCRHVDDMADMSCRHVAYSGQCLGPQRKTTSGTRVMLLNVADISW